MASEPSQAVRQPPGYYEPFKRCLDVLGAGSALVILAPVLALVAASVKLTSRGPVLYWSDRVGRHGVIFSMPKFRTMRIDTPEVATHLLGNAASYLTPVGGFLRRSSLDELPQLWTILTGRLSIVGPRPGLFNQEDLLRRRAEHAIDTIPPGLTGWAQINGRDDIANERKVELDREYLERRGLWLDVKIVLWTVFRVMRSDGVRH